MNRDFDSWWDDPHRHPADRPAPAPPPVRPLTRPEWLAVALALAAIAGVTVFLTWAFGVGD